VVTVIVTVILLIRGSILEVIGYRNAPPSTPTSVRCCGACPQGIFLSEKMTLLEISDMYLFVFDNFSQYLVITLLIG
jgi:hypothetical protein